MPELLQLGRESFLGSAGHMGPLKTETPSVFLRMRGFLSF
jgi:hypothetical protein